MLQKVNANKSSGHDNLSPIILKCFSNYLAPSTTSLINRSLSGGALPSEWLKANVCPVYKGKGGNSNVCNYSPISLLCVTSKVAERCIYNCIINHIRTFIYDFQNGFLKNRSTTTQLVQIFIDYTVCYWQQWSKWCFIYRFKVGFWYNPSWLTDFKVKILWFSWFST